MAENNGFIKGGGFAISGIKLETATPLDVRSVIGDMSVLTATDIKRIYNGLVAYEEKSEKLYVAKFNGELTLEQIQNTADAGGIWEEVGVAIKSVMTYKGSKTVAELNALGPADKEIGDVYNVEDTGELNGEIKLSVNTNENVAWDGKSWDGLGTIIDIDELKGELKYNQGSGIAISEDPVTKKSTISVNVSTAEDNAIKTQSDGSLYVAPTDLKDLVATWVEEI